MTTSLHIPELHERFDRMAKMNRCGIWDWSINADSIIDLQEHQELRRCRCIKIYHESGIAKFVRLKKDISTFLLDEDLVPFYMEHPTKDGKGVCVREEEVGDLTNLLPIQLRVGRMLERRGPQLFLNDEADKVILISDYPMLYKVIGPFVHIRKT